MAQALLSTQFPVTMAVVVVLQMLRMGQTLDLPVDLVVVALAGKITVEQEMELAEKAIQAEMVFLMLAVAEMIAVAVAVVLVDLAKPHLTEPMQEMVDPVQQVQLPALPLLAAVVAVVRLLDMEPVEVAEAAEGEMDKANLEVGLVPDLLIPAVVAEQGTLQPGKTEDLVLLLYDTRIHSEPQQPRDLHQ